MKEYLLFTLTVFLSLQCDGQKANRSKVATQAERVPADRQTSVHSLAEARSLSDAPPNLIIADAGRIDNYRYDPGDSKTVDDGILTLVTASGKRYKRVLAGYTVNLKSDFGAKGDGVTDDADKLQNAITFQQANPTVVITVPAGTYKLSTSCTKPQSFEGLEIRAVPNTVVFDYSNIARNKPCLKIVGGSGRICQNTIEGIIFKGNGTSTAIEIAGQCGQFVNKCVFQDNQVGLLYHNETPNSFTEWCTAQNCSWEATCRNDIEYRRSAGNNSFHGSGLTGVNYINTYKGGGTVLLVNDNCLPYNCPLNVQVWFSTNSVFIRNNNSNPTYKPYFAGNISFEHFGGSMVLGAGKPVYFGGTIESLGDYVDSGVLYQCEALAVNKNNSTTAYGVRYNTQLPLTTNSTVTNAPVGAIYQATVTVIGSDYDYRNVLIIDCTGGGSGKGSVTSLATTRAFNSAGYGPPAFGVDGSGRLTITNTSYPTSGPKQVKAYVTYRQIADHYYGNYPAQSF